MGFLSTLKGIFNPVDGIMDGVKDIIGLVTGKLPPDAQAEITVKMALLEAQAEKDKRNYELEIEKLYFADTANLREQIKVELKSEDPFVRRARPAWLWGLLVMYIINYPVTFIIGWFVPDIAPQAIPYQVHMLAGALVGGYQYLRSVEKTGQKLPFTKQNEILARNGVHYIYVGVDLSRYELNGLSA